MAAPNHTTRRLSIAILAVAGLWVAWSQNQQPAQLTMEKVTDGLYMIVGSGGNVAVMPTSEGVLLVDDKFAQDAPQILAKVKSVSDKPIRYVLNTHQHGDHTGGNEALMAANAEIVIHKNARANMAEGKMPGLPRITFSDESQVFLGGKEVVARHLGRGHTNGDAVIYFPSERVLHTGDLFVVGAPYCDTSGGGSIKEWDKTVQKALAYDFDKVIPGHGPVSTKADLAKWVQTLAAVRDHVKRACAAGPAADALKRIDLSDIGLKTGGAFDRGVPGMCAELSQ
jgi:glyoxylase-like metal-dependent hydrolase (beta-lactamase superfamily II)